MAERQRMQWKGRFEFLFTNFGFTIGLGNIWRFPENCYRNGGGAFLFPYLLTVVLCTVPMAFMEMSLGQFASEGPFRIWKFSPIFIGVGWARLFFLCLTSIYYVIPLLYAFYYMLVAFVNIGGTLPWQHCRVTDEWATEACLSGNTSAEENYWNRFVLGEHESEGLHDLGPVVGRNLVLLLLMWTIVYYCCVRGIRSIAKVIYVTATFPFGLIIVLLVRGMTLKGYEEGLAYYLKPDWSRLADIQIWSSAANQAIYSSGVSFGCIFALASHNKFNRNVFHEAVIIGFVNSFTSFLLGLIVFSYIGHASRELNFPIENMIDHGPGILFITYIRGLTTLPGSAVWCVLFFLMVFTLGLDSLFVQVWTMNSCIQDSCTRIGRRGKYWVLIGQCTVMFLLGIPLVTKGGIHMTVLMDSYIANIGLSALMLSQTISICLVYGLNNFIRDIEMMIGRRPNYFWWYWKGSWMIFVPICSVFIFIASFVGHKPPSYRGKVIPIGGEVIGWLIIVTPLVAILVGAIVQIRKYKGVKAAMRKSKSWGPRCLEDRLGPYASSIRRGNIDTVSRHLSRDQSQKENQKIENETFDILFDDSINRNVSRHAGIPMMCQENSQPRPCVDLNETNRSVELSSDCVLKSPSSPPIFVLDASSFDITDAPPTPHRFKNLNYDSHSSGEHFPGNGYITPVSEDPISGKEHFSNTFTDSFESSIDF